MMGWMALVGWVAVLLSMVPFIAKFAPKDSAPALAAPLYLIPRALVQCAAVLMSILEPTAGQKRPAGHVNGSNRAGPVPGV